MCQKCNNHKPPIIARVVKSSNVHKHTEWTDATPVGNMSFGSVKMENGPVVLVAVPSVLSSPLALLPKSV